MTSKKGSFQSDVAWLGRFACLYGEFCTLNGECELANMCIQDFKVAMKSGYSLLLSRPYPRC